MLRRNRHPVNLRMEDRATFGERSADVVVGVIGSWPSVLGHIGFILAWIAFNALHPHFVDQPDLTHLNLVLSCEAALAAALILLASKRSSAKDRATLEHDYAVTQQVMQKLEENTRLIIAFARNVGYELEELVEDEEKRY